MLKNSQFILDRMGICTSIACIIHCLAMPVMILLGINFTGELLGGHETESVIIILAIVIGLIAFVRGFLLHKQHYVPVLFISGILLIINGESVVDIWVSTSLSVAGAMIVAYAHFYNHRLRKACIRA